jgi:crossover junction endodeoxyribonuclease RuvC
LNPTRKRRIIGIDPGLASTGWGILEKIGNKLVYIAHGYIETKADRSRAERLFYIQSEIRLILDKYTPCESSIETLYFGKNVSSAIPVAEARGVISAALAERKLLIHEFTPNTIKKGVAGQIRADKKQVPEMVTIILGLEKIPKPDHAADALAVAICAANANPDFATNDNQHILCGYFFLNVGLCCVYVLVSS